MTICDYCGQRVEFRYSGGRPIPMHFSGSCHSSGRSASDLASSTFGTVASYTNPNALCPVCDATVFFYQSSNGGRVFFDALGWPWPKHPCTDKAASQVGKVRSPAIKRGGTSVLRDKAGISLDLYKLAGMQFGDAGWVIKLQKILGAGSFCVSLSNEQMESENLIVQDWRKAPSFVAAPTVIGAPTRVIHFICARLKKVITVELEKA